MQYEFYEQLSFGSTIIYRITDGKNLCFWSDVVKSWASLVSSNDTIAYVRVFNKIDPKIYDHPAFIKEQFYKDVLE